MPLPLRAIAAVVILAGLVGCAGTKQDNSFQAGATTISNGVKSGREAVDGLKTTNLTDKQAVYVGQIAEALTDIAGGNAKSIKAYGVVAGQADSSRQWLYRLYDLSTYIGGLCCVVGLAIVVAAIWNGSSGGKVLGIGLLVLGGSGIAVFSVLGVQAQITPWIVVGLGILLFGIVGGILYLLYDRYIAHRKIVTRTDASGALIAAVPPAQMSAIASTLPAKIQDTIQEIKTAASTYPPAAT